MNEKKHPPEPMFLLDGARFKLSFHDIHCDECGAENNRVTIDPLGMYANELQGKWVALVPAENDRHLELTKLPQKNDDLQATETNLRQQIAHLNDEIAGQKSTIKFLTRQRDEVLAALVKEHGMFEGKSSTGIGCSVCDLITNVKGGA